MPSSIKSRREPNVPNMPGARFIYFNQDVSFSDILTMSTTLLVKGKNISQHVNGRKNLCPTEGEKSHFNKIVLTIVFYVLLFYGHYRFLPKPCGNDPTGEEK